MKMSFKHHPAALFDRINTFWKTVAFQHVFRFYKYMHVYVYYRIKSLNIPLAIVFISYLPHAQMLSDHSKATGKGEPKRYANKYIEDTYIVLPYIKNI